MGGCHRCELRKKSLFFFGTLIQRKYTYRPVVNLMTSFSKIESRNRWQSAFEFLYLQLKKCTMTLANFIRIFRWISIMEGVSFLLLLFIAMPLKYIWELPQMVEVVGMLHGILFVAYIFGALYLYKPLEWKFKTLLIICAGSVLPFGPFYVEKKYL